MSNLDWVSWHEGYDRAGSGLARRLGHVQALVREALDTAAPGPIRAISMCAGQGRDLLGVLRDHPRRADVTARLVEWEPELAEYARRIAVREGLDGVQVVTSDASTTSAYAGMVPADLVLVCGVFGNIASTDIHRTVGELPRLTASGGTVVWTRHRQPPDLTPTIRGWFEDYGFEELSFGTPGGVGAHRFAGTPEPFCPDRTLFRFVPPEQQ